MKIAYLHHGEDRSSIGYYRELSATLDEVCGPMQYVDVSRTYYCFRGGFGACDLLILGKSVSEAMPAVRGLAGFRGPKLAFLTNEHRDMVPKLRYLQDAGCGWIATQYPEARVAGEYGRYTSARVVSFAHGVTPVHEALVPRPWSERRYDVSFRGFRYPYHLGHNDRERLAERLRATAAARPDLSISAPEEGHEFLPAARYLELLLDSRAVLGSEMGGDFIELEDTVRVKELRFEAERAQRGLTTAWADVERAFGHDFAQARARLPSGRGVSSRIFDAAMAGCLQILVEGEYQGLFEPWEHYVPLKRDASDWDAALAVIADRAHSEAIVARMRARCLASHRLADAVRTLIARVVSPAPR